MPRNFSIHIAVHVLTLTLTDLLTHSFDVSPHTDNRCSKLRTSCQMVCCLKDDYGFNDPVPSWTRCKLYTVLFIWITIIGLGVTRLFVYDSGFLGFAVVILTLYYLVTLILANLKPHGVYVLCKGDPKALKVCHIQYYFQSL